MGFAQLLERAGPMLEASMMDDGETNLAMLRRLATPKFNGLRPRQRQPMDETLPDGTGMLEPRDSMMPGADQLNPDPGFAPGAEQLNPDPGFMPRTTGPVMPALNAAPDDPTLLPRPIPGAPDMSKVAEPDIITAIAKLRERTLNPIKVDEPRIFEGELQQRPMQALEPVPEVDNGGRSVSGLIYDEGGRPLKPQYLEPSSDAALMGRQEYINALQNYKPVNRNSRLKSMAITAGRGALAGLVHGPGGAIGGALTGAIWGGVSPKVDEEFARRQDLGEARQELAGDLKFRDANNQNLLDRARVYRELNPAGQVLDTEGGFYRSTGTNAEPIRAGKDGPQLMPRDRAKGVKEEIRHDAFTGRAEKWEIRAGEPDKKVIGWSDPAKDMVKTEFGWVTPGAALQADATAENRNYTRGRQETNDNRQQQWRNEDKTQHNTERTEQRLAAASKIYTDIVNANAEAGKYKSLAERTPATAKDAYGNFLKPYYESMVESEKQKGIGFANQLASGYGDLYEAGPGDQGWAYAKLKPQPTGGQLQPRSQTKGKGKPGKIQPGEDPAIRDYANHYFRGDYAAAVEAIRKQSH